MRISTTRIYDNALTDIASASERLERANRVVSTGKKLTRPSDDPSGMAQALDMRNALDNMDQYARNVNGARGFAGTSDTALASAGNLLRQARTLAVQAANEAVDPQARIALADQVGRITDQLAAAANATYGSRYVFGGQRTTRPPFTPQDGSYAYQGGTAATSDADLTVEIGQNNPMVINVTGDRLFSAAFDALNTLRDHIANNQTDLISRDDLTALDAALNPLNQSRAEIGARIQLLDQTGDRLSQMQTEFTEYLSRIEDADIPTAVLSLRTAETAYQSALTAASHGFQQSLLDFLK